MVRSIKDKHPNYFEAILQLRDVKQEVHDFVAAEIKRQKIPVTKVKTLKTGTDLYLADGQFTKSLGRKLQQQFGGKVLNTASLFGQKKGKEIFRITVLFRGVPFKKGDVVDYNGDRYNVRSLGKDILLQDEKTGKKVHIDYKEIKQIQKVEDGDN